MSLSIPRSAGGVTIAPHQGAITATVAHGHHEVVRAYAVGEEIGHTGKVRQ